MCGIYGSNDLATFEVLGDANRERGNFSTGVLYKYRDSSYQLQKKEGTPRWSSFNLPINEFNKEKVLGDYMYLGHNQAPTSSKRDWDKNTSHPFQYGDWVVAHNGVLTNFEELINEYIPHHDNEVDSSIIPALLYEFEYKYDPCEDSDTEIQNIIHTLELIEGTFAVWILNIKTMNVYIARQGSTLFYKDSNISSIQGCDYQEVKEGVLYAYTAEGILPVEGFVNKSPFFTL
tara:strand:- start:236 stop:931 length:696 start_codon:yes stop_codon:yes gene_type:complete